MTGNVTDLETSRRLAKVLSPSEEHNLWWIQMENGGAWALTEVAACEIHHEYGDVTGCVAAYDLSELEAKIWEMGLRGNIYIRPKNISCILIEDNSERAIGGEADHIINALGTAVAEALEKAEEKP